MVRKIEGQGVYVMRIAATLSGMHPQTLRKYERVGFLNPSRIGMLRMYSDEDIALLRTIKYLVDGLGLNLAGVELALQFRYQLFDLLKEVSLLDLNGATKERLRGRIANMLESIGHEMTGKDSG